MFQFTITCGRIPPRVLLLRELTGRAELRSFAGPAAVTHQLLEELLVEPGGAAGAALVAELTLAERDRIIVELYRLCFGDEVAFETACGECGRGLGVRFPLTSFVEQVESTAMDVLVLDDGWFSASGLTVRLPTLEDEAALWGVAPERRRDELLSRCLRGAAQVDAQSAGDASSDSQGRGGLLDRVEALLSEVGPLVSGSIRTTCGECGATQEVEFDIVDFFARALELERPVLMREIHCLARAYGWSLESILDLPRERRRELVALVLAEAERSRGAA